MQKDVIQVFAILGYPLCNSAHSEPCWASYESH